MIETNRIEFKRELTRELDIEKEVVAFLNYREGGIIYIGVDDSGKPVGVKDIDSDMLTIKIPGEESHPEKTISTQKITQKTT